MAPPFSDYNDLSDFDDKEDEEDQENLQSSNTTQQTGFQNFDHPSDLEDVEDIPPQPNSSSNPTYEPCIISVNAMEIAIELVLLQLDQHALTTIQRETGLSEDQEETDQMPEIHLMNEEV